MCETLQKCFETLQNTFKTVENRLKTAENGEKPLKKHPQNTLEVIKKCFGHLGRCYYCRIWAETEIERLRVAGTLFFAKGMCQRSLDPDCTLHHKGRVRGFGVGCRCFGAAAVAAGAQISKLNVDASETRPVRLGCCEAWFQLANAHIIASRLARTAILWRGAWFFHKILIKI